ncbi:MAG: class I SAM-dependent methyltransferase [Bacilli bacterium]|nr:class I SAM-dependent methyltransferase [Bacilli bacterium]
MSHYFTNDKIKSEEKKVNVKIKNQDYTFITDNGVFSKKGLDFGTRTLLESLNVDKLKGDVLDFGTGYGPIGIFIAKNTSANVDMIDVNERSLSLASKNAELNNVKTNIFKSDIYENVTKKYDYIITNPPIRVGKEILYKILFEAENHLKPNGEMWIVVNKDQGAKSTLKDLSKIYETEVVNKNKGFYIIKSKKH